MFRSALRTFLALVVAATTLGPALAAVAADDPIGATPSVTPALTWGLVPATAEGVPDGRVSFRVEAEPGEVVTQYALLVNYSDRDAEFQIFASDGIVTSDGTFDILPSDETAQDSGAWIDVQRTATVPAQSGVLIPFTITVPVNVTPGDHPAGITAGVSQGSSAQDGPMVGLDTRVGLRIHLRVTGDIHATTVVQGLVLRYETSWNPFAPGRLYVEYSVANTGNVRLQSDDALRYAGPWGVAASDYSGEMMTAREVLPLSTKEVTEVITGVWPLGRIVGTLAATPAVVGDDDLAGVQLVIAEATATTWAVPWPQLAVLIMLIGLVWEVRRRRRRGRVAYAAALERARAEGAAAVLATGGADEGTAAVAEPDAPA